MTIAVIDYGMGNLHSVVKALEHVGGKNVRITSDISTILDADKVVLPGVGAIGDCMTQICNLKLDKVILQVSQDRPFLGICVGMQVLLSFSEESFGVDCLGLFNGKVKHLSHIIKDQNLKIPHMGWNKVSQTQDHSLWHGIGNNEYFYFVHSYYVQSDDLSTIGKCNYGNNFSCAIGRDYIFAMQFHPEKSSTTGLKLLKNFVNWNGKS